ncbi:MAG: hypothetical protein ACR2OH_13570 [Microthrixaceae bacterium]
MSLRTPIDLGMGVRLMLLIVVLPLIALMLTLVGFVVFEAVGIIGGGTSSDNIDELFARCYATCLLACIAVPILASPGLRRRMIGQRWVRIVALLFAVGSIFALADPFNAVRAESNMIRYWTAGILIVAAVTALVSAANPSHVRAERLIGIGFALVLILGAADELLQLHESVGGRFESAAPALGNTSAQDLVLLGLAAAGMAAAVTVVVLWRFVPGVRDLAARRSYQRAFALFALAVVTFGSAMMLDSFDWVLQGFLDPAQELVGGSAETVGVAWLAGDPINRAANSVEELLEFLAALFFLMMVGAFFSVSALGWTGNADGETAG